MEKKHIITIAGRPGSGKSSTAKAVANQLEFLHFSSGDLFRAIGKDLGVDVLQTNLNAEQNAEIDHLVDGRLRDIGASEDKRVIDSRTAWHWIPSSFKVFLDLDLQTAAQRILNTMDDTRLANERIHRDPAEYAQVLRARLESENRRYKTLYDIDPYDMKNYDLVLDTQKYNLEQVVQMVVDGYDTWIKEQDEEVGRRT
jgi:cytidylate kinase